jgi:hypothetical protein
VPRFCSVLSAEIKLLATATATTPTTTTTTRLLFSFR